MDQSSFGLLDDGRPPEKVLHFYQQTNLPLRVGIMLDTSSSIRGRFAFEQDSAVAFLLQVLHRNDRAFVEGFDVEMDVSQGFTNNIDLLNQGIKKLRPGGGTALYDALYSTCKDQMLTLKEAGAVRKAIILVSDGDDNYSHALRTDAIKECQRAETIVYAISTDVKPSRDQGDDNLKAIADETGGRAFFPTRSRTSPRALTVSRKSCAANICWNTCPQTSSRMGLSAPSICMPTTRAIRFGRTLAISLPRRRNSRPKIACRAR